MGNKRSTTCQNREMNEVLLLMAKAAGCTCQPEVKSPDVKRGAVAHAVVLHDDGCALLQEERKATKPDGNRGNPPEPPGEIEPAWEEVESEEVPALVQKLVTNLLLQEQRTGCLCDPEVAITRNLSTVYVTHEGGCPLHGAVRAFATPPPFVPESQS